MRVARPAREAHLNRRMRVPVKPSLRPFGDDTYDWARMPHKRILIVEDDVDLRRIFRTALSLAGYEVEATGDGIEALHLIDNRAPDLVVLDLILRSLDGLSIQQELASQAITRSVPIVIVTGSSIDTDSLDVSCVLHKPVMPDQLVRTVNHCLRAGAAAARV